MPKDIAVLTKQDADTLELLEVRVFRGATETKSAIQRALAQISAAQRDALLYPPGSTGPNLEIGWEDAKDQADQIVGDAFAATTRGERFTYYVTTRAAQLSFTLWEVKAQ